MSIRSFDEACESNDDVFLLDSSTWLDALVEGYSVSCDNFWMIDKSYSHIFALVINALL